MRLEIDISEKPMPVIIGTGITGMVISHSLSQKKIDHIAVGMPPHPTRPRLGESINGEGSLDLEEMFPEFSKYFFPKKNIIFYTGSLVSRCDLDTSKQPIFATLFKLLGFKEFKHLLHVDRLGFDHALFEQVTQSKYCLSIQQNVVDIVYDDGQDLIQFLILENGLRLKPTFVFDATNHVRFLPKKLNIPCYFSSKPQKVFYTHYRRPNFSAIHVNAQPQLADWIHSTNLLKLCETIDGIDGMAWCIPLGDYISVGMSVDADNYAGTDQNAISLLDQAYQRRGIDYCQHYSQRTEIISVEHQYFKHERSGGTNWLLAGGTYSQVWFPTGSGVATSLYTARFADRFLRSPKKTRRQYEHFMSQFFPSHNVHSQLIASDISELSYQQMYQWTDALLTTTLLRICTYAQSRNSKIGGLFAQLISFLMKTKILRIKFFCKILELDLNQQTTQIHLERLTYL